MSIRHRFGILIILGMILTVAGCGMFSSTPPEGGFKEIHQLINEKKWEELADRVSTGSGMMDRGLQVSLLEQTFRSFPHDVAIEKVDGGGSSASLTLNLGGEPPNRMNMNLIWSSGKWKLASYKYIR